jgi:hypothetical protein
MLRSCSEWWLLACHLVVICKTAELLLSWPYGATQQSAVRCMSVNARHAASYLRIVIQSFLQLLDQPCAYID